MRYSSVVLHKDKSILQTRWLRTVNSREYRSGITYFCKLIKEHQPQFWLVDAVRFNSPSLDDQKWAVKKMSRMFESLSLKKVAIVLPDDLFLEVVVERMKEDFTYKAKKGISVRDFKSFNQAEEWLQSSFEQDGLFRVDALQNEYSNPSW